LDQAFADCFNGGEKRGDGFSRASWGFGKEPFTSNDGFVDSDG
jgi:hypothetical protein